MRYDDVGRYREHPHGDEGGCLGEGCSDEGGKGGVPITPQWLHISTLPTLQWDIRGYVMIALDAGRPTLPRCPSTHAYTPSNRCAPLPLSLSLPLSPEGQPGLREGHTGRTPARDDPRQVRPCSLLEGVDGGGSYFEVHERWMCRSSDEGQCPAGKSFRWVELPAFAAPHSSTRVHPLSPSGLRLHTSTSRPPCSPPSPPSTLLPPTFTTLTSPLRPVTTSTSRPSLSASASTTGCRPPPCAATSPPTLPSSLPRHQVRGGMEGGGCQLLSPGRHTLSIKVPTPRLTPLPALLPFPPTHSQAASPTVWWTMFLASRQWPPLHPVPLPPHTLPPPPPRALRLPPRCGGPRVRHRGSGQACGGVPARRRLPGGLCAALCAPAGIQGGGEGTLGYKATMCAWGADKLHEEGAFCLCFSLKGAQGA